MILRNKEIIEANDCSTVATVSIEEYFGYCLRYGNCTGCKYVNKRCIANIYNIIFSTNKICLKLLTENIKI